MIVTGMITPANAKGLNIIFEKHIKIPQWSKQQILGRWIFLLLRTLG